VRWPLDGFLLAFRYLATILLDDVLSSSVLTSFFLLLGRDLFPHFPAVLSWLPPLSPFFFLL